VRLSYRGDAVSAKAAADFAVLKQSLLTAWPDTRLVP
jgi:hypothetical protein